MLSDNQRSNAVIPTNALQRKNEQSSARKDAQYSFRANHQDTTETILTADKRAILSSFLDFMWEQTKDSSGDDRVDMRLRISDDAFTHLIGDQNRQFTGKVHGLFKNFKSTLDRNGSRLSKIALRMTVGPTNACIDFHCDGNYATRTVQIAINDSSEY